MSLTQALQISSSGLRTVQAGLALVSSNVANAETPGYIRKTLSQSATGQGAACANVRIDGVNRELNQYLQRQLRIEDAGGQYANVRAQFFDRLQVLFRQPGANSTLETAYNGLTSALGALAGTPESYSAQRSALSAAQGLTGQLNGMSNAVQGLRGEAEAGIAGAVASANAAMRTIADLNARLSTAHSLDAATATLMDQRDRAVDQLSQLMDVRVSTTGNNQISVATNAGIQLVRVDAAQLTFDARGALRPDATWSTDANTRGVGTISLTTPSGDSVDLLAMGAIRSGRLAALVDMRDHVLVDAQGQLDGLAAGMAQMLSDKTVAGSAVSAGAQNGFDLDIAGMLPGNSVQVRYTDVASGLAKTVTLMRVDDASALPLSNDITANPNDRVVGISFSGGMASIASQIGAALGSGFTVTSPSGTTLRVLDDGAATRTLSAMQATKTATAVAGGDLQAPLFLDGTTAYSGAITGAGAQQTGLAGRISVNGGFLSDPAKLVAYSTSPPTLAGDTARVDFLLSRLSTATTTFSPAGDIGSTGAPISASLPNYLRQILTQQGEAAAQASSLQQGQEVVVNALQERFSSESGVDVDQEMAHLLQLQSAYAANARVMSAVRDMLDQLMRV